MWKEIKAQDYQRAEVTLRHYLQKWREVEDGEMIKSSAPGRAPSTRRLKLVLFGKQEKPNQQWEQIFLQQFCQKIPEIETGQKLVKEFYQMITDLQAEGFKRWLEEARTSGAAELVWFANMELNKIARRRTGF